MPRNYSIGGRNWPSDAPEQTGYDSRTAFDPNEGPSDTAATANEEGDAADYLADVPVEEQPEVFERVMERVIRGDN